MKLQKILLPLDGSLLAEAALPKAVELIEGSGAKLLLLRSAEPRTSPGAGEAALVKDAEDYVMQIQGS